MIKIDKLASEESRIRWLTGMTPWLLAMLLIGDAIGCLATKRPGGLIGSNSALFPILLMHFFFAPSATRIRAEQIRRLDTEITDLRERLSGDHEDPHLLET